MNIALASLFFLHLIIGVASAKEPPKGKIMFEEQYFDFGKAVEGDQLTHSFKFKNTGRGATTVKGLKSSCGCTAATMPLKQYKAGEEGAMTVTVDTRDKHGFITKTVEVSFENDASEKASVVMTVNLAPPPHPEAEPKTVVTRDERCKKCHLDAGVGFEEGFLYHRICVQCHGSRGEGATAKGFTSKEWQESVNDDFLKKVIRRGIEDKKMPPYVDGVVPPLTDKQVDSLVTYLRTLKKQ